MGRQPAAEVGASGQGGLSGEPRPSMVLPALGVAALVAVIAIGVAVGTDKWDDRGVAAVPPAVVQAP